MKNKRVIITSILIDKPKQVKLFQIKLPRDTKRVLGVETSLIWMNGSLPALEVIHPWNLPAAPKRSHLIGEVKLQSTGTANIFYTNELFASPAFDFGDLTAEWLEEKPCHTNGQSFDSNIEIEAEGNVLLGFFNDKVFEQHSSPYAYKVNIYVWVELLTCN